MGIAGYNAWDNIVDAYTRASLSVQSDKLVALSGVAKEMEAIMQDHYVAGMWFRRLEYGLLWRVLGSRRCRPSTIRAPSRSWVSVDGLIYSAYRRSARFHFKVLAHHLDYETDDHTGLIRGGWLELRGTLKRLEFQGELTPKGDDCPLTVSISKALFTLIIPMYSQPPSLTTSRRRTAKAICIACLQTRTMTGSHY